MIGVMRTQRRLREKPVLAAIPVVPLVGIGICGTIVTSVWLLKEKIVSRLISLQLGARVHIGRVDVRFLEGLSSIEFSLQNTRLVDSRNLEALYIPKASVNMIRRKGKYHIDVSVENPQTTVYFENYALTRTNWRRLLAAAKKRRRKMFEDAVKIDDAGVVRVRGYELTSVSIKGVTVLRAFSEPLGNERLFQDVEMSGLTVRPADFQSLERTIQVVEYITARAVLTLNKKSFPDSLKKQMFDYSNRILRKESKGYIDLGKIKVRELDDVLETIESNYNFPISSELKDALKLGRGMLRGIEDFLRNEPSTVKPTPPLNRGSSTYRDEVVD